MAAHTQIIDLYGIPACGKSTLAAYMRSNNGFKKIGTWADAKKEMRKSSMFKKLNCISFMAYWDGLRFAYFFPRANREKRSLCSWLNSPTIRSFIRKYSQYDIIVCEHGMAQSIISWEGGIDFHEYINFKQLVKNYIRHSSDSIFVRCNVSIGTAISRIKSRNRDSGRLDIQRSNDNEIENLFIQEKMRFDRLSDILNESDAVTFELDTEQNPKDSMEKLCQLIEKK